MISMTARIASTLTQAEAEHFLDGLGLKAPQIFWVGAEDFELFPVYFRRIDLGSGLKEELVAARNATQVGITTAQITIQIEGAKGEPKALCRNAATLLKELDEGGFIPKTLQRSSRVRVFFPHIGEANRVSLPEYHTILQRT